VIAARRTLAAEEGPDPFLVAAILFALGVLVLAAPDSVPALTLPGMTA
jgi:hypothetical protein